MCGEVCVWPLCPGRFWSQIGVWVCARARGASVAQGIPRGFTMHKTAVTTSTPTLQSEGVKTAKIFVALL